MIIKKEELRSNVTQNAKDGIGDFHTTHIMEAEHFLGSGRLYAVCTLAPGNSVGAHTHHGETEVYHILSGTGTLIEGGVETVMNPGDINITGDGGDHSIINTGSEDLVFVALILYNNAK